MTTRHVLTGQQVIVEYRSSSGRYFICYPELNRELVMSFETRQAAGEIAVNAEAGTPFFTMIPTVEYRTPYPRPRFVYPKVRDMSTLSLVMVD